VRRFGTNSVADYARSDTGAVALIAAVLAVVLVGSAALVVDMGALYSSRRQLQTTADAAALAGVRELPVNPSSAATIARDYSALNGPFADDVTVTLKRTYVNNDTIEVVVRQTESPHFFARVFGLDSSPVSARATAVAGSPTAYNSGVMPFAILARNSMEPPWGYLEKELIQLVVGHGTQTAGNYNWLDLKGFSSYSNVPNIIADGGTSKRIAIGDIAPTQTGGASNPRYTALANHVSKFCAPHQINDSVMGLRREASSNLYEPRHLNGTVCNRMIVAPVVVINQGDPFGWSSISGSTNVRIIGFATVFIRNNPSDSGGVMGMFVQAVPTSSVSPGAYSAYAGLLTWLAE